MILSDRKEDIKKKLETEKKLQDAIKKAKEKGIQNASIPTVTNQLNYKNFELITNRNGILSLNFFIYICIHTYMYNTNSKFLILERILSFLRKNEIDESKVERKIVVRSEFEVKHFRKLH